MGLLDRWSKKKKQEQLEQTVDKKTEEKVVAEKKEEVREEKTAKAAVKKTTKKTVAPKASKKEETKEEVKVEEIKKEVKAEKGAILIKPLVTEKAAIMQSANKYSFLVDRSANKYQIKEAVLKKYGVKPVAVNVVNVQGKFVRFGRTMGKRSDFRKAIVTLPQGKSITVHEGV